MWSSNDGQCMQLHIHVHAHIYNVHTHTHTHERHICCKLTHITLSCDHGGLHAMCLHLWSNYLLTFPPCIPPPPPPCSNNKPNSLPACSRYPPLSLLSLHLCARCAVRAQACTAALVRRSDAGSKSVVGSAM